MTNIRYAVLIIGALSLLLGLSLGQIYFQHQRIEQLEFNRFRHSSELSKSNWHTCATGNYCSHNLHRAFDSHLEAMERAKAEMLRRREHKLRNEANEVEKRLQNAIRQYNKELQLWESNKKEMSTQNGLYRFEE
jgi:biopolymer transport protein ExbB/TolQ